MYCISTVYEDEVYNNGPKINNNNDNDDNNNGKIFTRALPKELSKKDIITIEEVSHTKYTGIGLVYLIMSWKSKRNKDSKLKWEIIKKKKPSQKYKAGERYCLQWEFVSQ